MTTEELLEQIELRDQIIEQYRRLLARSIDQTSRAYRNWQETMDAVREQL